MIAELERTKRKKTVKINPATKLEIKNIPVDMTAPTPTKAAAPKKQKISKPKAVVVIDHPEPGSKIHPHHYAVRIGAVGGDAVEISFKKDAWLPCRHTNGYWWYDWHNIPQGGQKITARMKTADGKFVKSKVTSITVL